MKNFLPRVIWLW